MIKYNGTELIAVSTSSRKSDKRFHRVLAGSPRRVCMALTTLLLFATPAAGSVIVSTFGAVAFGSFFPVVDNPLIGLNGYAVGWTQTSTYTNVTIQALVASINGSSASLIDGFLTDSAGTVIASDLNDTIAISNGFVKTFFSGLSLGPGSYYFVLSPPNRTTTAAWYLETGAGAVTSPGSAFNGNYQAFGGSLTSPLGVKSNAGTDSSYQFQVTGTASPEPGTIGTILAGSLGIALMMRRRKSLKVRFAKNRFS